MIERYFKDLTDSRQQGKVKHNLLEIVVITICAVMAGCEVWEDICDYCRVKEEWFRERLHMGLKNGIPSHDTMQRVWGMIEPEEFERCFREWVGSVCKKVDGEIVSIDGKTMRGSREKGKSAIHMVSAWSHENQMVLGQMRTEEKSNEITAVPELLEVLDVAGCIITADAMSCQKEIAKGIVAKQADYVLGLKGNQPMLLRECKEYFQAARENPQLYPDIESMRVSEKGHGRIESRSYYLTNELEWLEQREEWSGLRGLGKVHSRVETDGNITEEDRYYITSLTDIGKFSKAVRAHWGIENSLHWCLDMTFHEDYSRMRKDHTAENMAVVRHLALNMLKSHPAKASIARKRRRCSYDDAFLAELLLSLHA